MTDTATPGAELRATVLDRYDLAPHEAALLDQAAATLDVIAELQANIDAHGALIDVGGRQRTNPAVSEVRAQRLVLGRLLAALALPDEFVPEHTPPARRPRGFYGRAAR